MAASRIEWTDVTWNPATGCDKVSSGCKHCYAEVMAHRLQAMGLDKYKNGFQITLHEESLKEPYKWKKPRIVFVNSMSDLFHEKIPFEFIEKVFIAMNDNPHHVFQILTKRPEILCKYDKNLRWTHNIWMGVTVENEKFSDRIDLLRTTNARVKFLSCEPLLSPLKNLNLNGIDWVIVGGESGNKARPMKKEWVTEIKTQCDKSGVKFFFKQWGGKNKKKNGREIDGKTFNDMPLPSDAMQEIYHRAI